MPLRSPVTPLVFLVCLLTGCAVDNAHTDIGAGVAYHSGVTPAGDGIWQAAVEASPFRGRIRGAKALVIQDALEKCGSEGKSMKVMTEQTESHFLINGVARLTFRCV